MARGPLTISSMTFIAPKGITRIGNKKLDHFEDRDVPNLQDTGIILLIEFKISTGK